MLSESSLGKTRPAIPNMLTTDTPLLPMQNMGICCGFISLSYAVAIAMMNTLSCYIGSYYNERA